MNAPHRFSRVFVALVAACAVGAAGCSSGSAAGETQTTIGLGSDLELASGPIVAVGENGETAADADVIDTVVMIGDSITVGATPSLDERFAELGLEPVIEAETGKRMAVSSGGNDSGASVAEDLALADDRDPATEVWVVALGTNDIGQYSSPADIAAAVNEVLGEVPSDAAVIWVDTYFRDRPLETDELNAIVVDRVERRGNAVIAPWSLNALGEGVMSGDGVHPTDIGFDRFAAVVADTVRSFLDR
ncbi:MAG: SGNH/GDSL hydrolase family protein [Ilumatobacteraceae bacterium]